MNEILQKLYGFCMDAGLKLVYAVLILVIGLKLIKFLSKVIKKANTFNKLEAGAKTFLESFINWMKNDHSWCAYTMGYFTQKAGMDMPKLPTVQAYIDKYINDYNKIHTQKMTPQNYKDERSLR